MPYMMLSCGRCGHQADLDDWCSTPISGPLPKNTYQCPNCRTAIERRATPGTLYESGLYVPGPVELVVVNSRM